MATAQYRPAAILGVAGDVNAPSSHTAAVITYAAVPGACNAVGEIHWSYDSTPTGGNLTIKDGAAVVYFSVDISAAGPGQFVFPIPKKLPSNVSMVVTLTDGGVGVTGKVGCTQWTE